MEESVFRQLLHDEGFGEAVSVDWPAGKNNPEHTHDFTARGLVISGDMTLGTADGERALGPGDTFRMQAGVAHSEVTGSGGAKLLVGRK